MRGLGRAQETRASFRRVSIRILKVPAVRLSPREDRILNESCAASFAKTREEAGETSLAHTSSEEPRQVVPQGRTCCTGSDVSNVIGRDHAITSQREDPKRKSGVNFAHAFPGEPIHVVPANGGHVVLVQTYPTSSGGITPMHP